MPDILCVPYDVVMAPSPESVLTVAQASDEKEGPRSLFARRGQLVIPTAAAVGPWRPDGLHGGAVSALLGHSLQEEGWQLARLTMDLIRRVPSQPLRVSVATTARSRRVLRNEVELWADDRLVAKAAGLLLPESHVALPPQPDRRLNLPDPVEDGKGRELAAASIAERIGYVSFVSHAVITRTAPRVEIRGGGAGKDGGDDGGDDGVDDGGHAGHVFWLKLLLPVVAGEEITPMQRVAAAADYANGGFPSLPFERWSFMSLDLTVQLTRAPAGEWIGVTSDSLASTTGIGLGDAELHDVNGRIGRAVATLLVEPRRPTTQGFRRSRQ